MRDIYEDAVVAYKSTSTVAGFNSVMRAMGYSLEAHQGFWELLESYEKNH